MSYDDEQEDTGGISELRKHAKELADANKALAAELESFRKEKATTTVQSVLKAKGLPDKVAALYQGEASEDAVSKWAEEYADVFGVKPASPQNDPNAAAAAMISAASFGVGTDEPALGPSGKVHGDPLELLNLINTLPYEKQVELGFMPNPKTDPFKRPVGDF